MKRIDYPRESFSSDSEIRVKDISISKLLFLNKIIYLEKKY